MDEKQTTAMTTDIRALIADDGYAASFQSMGQYRTALLAALRAQADAAPVAWITKEQLQQMEEWTADAWVYWRESGHVAEPDELPLFLHPSLPAAQGLSDDEITQVWLDHGGSLNGNNFRSFARAILSRAATAGAGAENGSTAAQSQARSQSTLVPNGAATVAEPSEACRECNGAGKVDVTHSPLRDGYTETVRECCGTCGGTGKSEVSDGEREIREIWTTQAERENAQRTRMLDRFANRAATPATADFDLIAPNDAQAAQQQAKPCPICFGYEPHSGSCGSSHPDALCNRKSQQAEPTIPMEVLRVTYAPDMTAEEFARMWPKFKAWQQAEAAFKDAPPEAAQVVDQHFWELKGNQQAEPGADERAARLVEDAAQRLENSGFTAHAEAVRAAQSGQRAGVAEKDKDSVVVPRWLWDRMNAAPTQQQEQGE